MASSSQQAAECGPVVRVVRTDTGESIDSGALVTLQPVTRRRHKRDDGVMIFGVSIGVTNQTGDPVNYRLKMLQRVPGLSAVDGAGVIQGAATAVIGLEYRVESATGPAAAVQRNMPLHIRTTTVAGVEDTVKFVCCVPSVDADDGDIDKTAVGAPKELSSNNAHIGAGDAAWSSLDRVIAFTTSQIFLALSTVALEKQDRQETLSSSDMDKDGIVEMITNLVMKQMARAPTDQYTGGRSRLERFHAARNTATQTEI